MWNVQKALLAMESIHARRHSPGQWRSALAKRLCVVSALCASAGVAWPAAAAQAVTPKPFDIFVDPPTGFVFVKLPTAWKFVGKLSAQDMRALPSTVITSLLPTDDIVDSAVASSPLLLKP